MNNTRSLYQLRFIAILAMNMLLTGCESNLTPEPEKLERAHPAPVGSAFIFDEYSLDTQGIMTDPIYAKTTYTDSIVRNGMIVGGKKNVTAFLRTQKEDTSNHHYHYYNFEDNGDLSIAYESPLIDSFWTTYPIESRKRIIKTYYDSSVRTGHVRRDVTTFDYDSTVSIVIGSTTLKAHKIRTQHTQTADFKKGGKFVYVANGYVIIAPSIGYIVEWRIEPYTVNGYFDTYSQGALWILKDYHIQ